MSRRSIPAEQIADLPHRRALHESIGGYVRRDER
jgi:hypothetical protein